MAGLTARHWPPASPPALSPGGEASGLWGRCLGFWSLPLPCHPSHSPRPFQLCPSAGDGCAHPADLLATWGVCQGLLPQLPDPCQGTTPGHRPQEATLTSREPILCCWSLTADTQSPWTSALRCSPLTHLAKPHPPLATHKPGAPAPARLHGERTDGQVDGGRRVERWG